MPGETPYQRALVADPTPHMAGLVASMLHSLRIRAVEIVSEPPRFAALLAAQPFDVLLVDEQLVSPSGFALVRALRQQEGHINRHVPIIVMAGAPDAAMIAAARDAGVTEFLRKPFSANHIRSRLESMRAAPRQFVEVDGYAGPDRRRRALGGQARRADDDA